MGATTILSETAPKGSCFTAFRWIRNDEAAGSEQSPEQTQKITQNSGSPNITAKSVRSILLEDKKVMKITVPPMSPRYFQRIPPLALVYLLQREERSTEKYLFDNCHQRGRAGCRGGRNHEQRGRRGCFTANENAVPCFMDVRMQLHFWSILCN